MPPARSPLPFRSVGTLPAVTSTFGHPCKRPFVGIVLNCMNGSRGDPQGVRVSVAWAPLDAAAPQGMFSPQMLGVVVQFQRA